MFNYFRRDLVGFVPYDPEEAIYDIKLDANENPYPHPEVVINCIQELMTNSDIYTRYPDTTVSTLVSKLADKLDVEKENIVCGVGSDQIIDSLIKVFIEPGDKVLMPTPSFSMYKQSCQINYGVAVEYTLNEDDFEYDVDGIIDVVRDTKYKLIIICSPNNPTGNVLSLEDLNTILEEVECPVVVDEAYIEFGGESAVSLTTKYNNLVILRTFSKAFGLAGLRIGYAVASKEVIEMIKVGLPPYNLNTVSQKIAELVVDYEDEYKEIFEKIISSREKLMSKLEEIDCVEKVYSSKANFLLVKCKEDNIAKKLKESDIVVRDFSKHPMMPNCIRISVGTEEENEKLINVLKTI